MVKFTRNKTHFYKHPFYHLVAGLTGVGSATFKTEDNDIYTSNCHNLR